MSGILLYRAEYVNFAGRNTKQRVQMRKLVCVFFAVSALWFTLPVGAQEDRRQEHPADERPQATLVLTVTDNRVRIQNAVPGTLMEVYNILGVKLLTVRIEAEDHTVTLDIPKGYYILKIGNVARKVVIK